jgi:hypothetical protein
MIRSKVWNLGRGELAVRTRTCAANSEPHSGTRVVQGKLEYVVGDVINGSLY